MKSTTFIATLALLPLVGCGPAVDQPPEQQTIADVVHSEIRQRFSGYRREVGVKVMAACLKWQTDGPVIVSGVSSYYIPARVAVYGPQFRLLRQYALGDCKSEAPDSGKGCTCQVVDENNRNFVKAPATVTPDNLWVEFDDRRIVNGPPEKDWLEREDESKFSRKEKMERKAGRCNPDRAC